MVERRWVITGASRGIGAAVGRLAHTRGDRVALVARGAAVLDVAADLGTRAMGVRADVTDADQLHQAFATVAHEWGGVDVLVNNAGVHRGGRIGRLTRDDWDTVLATNLTAPYECIRQVVALMPDEGAVVGIGAVVGFRGYPGDSPYGAAKAGLEGLTRVLAMELAARRIRVNLVVPGFVETEMTGGLSERTRTSLTGRIPLGRTGLAEEIADVVWWVASSPYMTGSTVTVDGGLMAALGSAQ